MMRKRVNRKRDSKHYKRTVSRTKSANLRNVIYRGGARL